MQIEAHRGGAAFPADDLQPVKEVVGGDVRKIIDARRSAKLSHHYRRLGFLGQATFPGEERCPSTR